MTTDREWRESARVGEQAMIRGSGPNGKLEEKQIIRGTATQITTADGKRWMRTTGRLVGSTSLWPALLVKPDEGRKDQMELERILKHVRSQAAQLDDTLSTASRILASATAEQAASMGETLEVAVMALKAHVKLIKDGK